MSEQCNHEWRMWKDAGTVCVKCNMNAINLIADLRAKLAAAERERDELFSHNVILRQTLKSVCDECDMKEDCKDGICLVRGALTLTPADSAARVQSLVDALETVVDVIDVQLGGGGYVPEFGADINEKLEPWASIFDAQSKAQAALKAWREGRGIAKAMAMQWGGLFNLNTNKEEETNGNSTKATAT